LNETAKVNVQLRVHLGDGSNERTRCKFGVLRTMVKDYCQQRVDLYKDKIHRGSHLYFVRRRNQRKCEVIDSTATLYSVVESLKAPAGSTKSKTVEKSIRLALTCIDGSNQPAWKIMPELLATAPDDASCLQSQPLSAHSPVMKALVNQCEHRAATRSFSEPKELVHELYTNEESPFYHGFTLEMYDHLVMMFAAEKHRKTYSLRAGEPYPEATVQKLVAVFQHRNVKQLVNNLIPAKGVYPPDGNDEAPSHPPPAPEDFLGGQLSRFGEAMTRAVGAIARTGNAVPAIAVMRYVHLLLTVLNQNPATHLLLALAKGASHSAGTRGPGTIVVAFERMSASKLSGLSQTILARTTTPQTQIRLVKESI
jgi:hypothetical protein